MYHASLMVKHINMVCNSSPSSQKISAAHLLQSPCISPWWKHMISSWWKHIWSHPVKIRPDVRSHRKCPFQSPPLAKSQGCAIKFFTRLYVGVLRKPHFGLTAVKTLQELRMVPPPVILNWRVTINVIREGCTNENPEKNVVFCQTPLSLAFFQQKKIPP